MAKGRRRGRTPKSKTNAVTIERAARIARVLEFRLQGWTLEKIAQAEGVVRSRVHAMIDKALTSMVSEPADQIMQLELARLDAMFIKPFELSSGDHFNPIAIDKCLAIMERRAKYLGLNAPEKLEVDEVGELAQAKIELMQKLDGMARRLAEGTLKLIEPPKEPPVIEDVAVEQSPAEPTPDAP
jgi:hypothetical protein